MFLRVILFVATNLLVIIGLSIVTSLLGLNRYMSSAGIDYQALLVFCLFWGMAGSFISLMLSRWMAKTMMGVKVLVPGQAGEYEWLVNMVHNVAKNASLPAMPEVGVFESDTVNAFATGPSKSRSIVAFSTALLHSMGRKEIEGVTGHEIAHIQNGDMVTMTLIQGVINAFVMFFSRIVAWFASQAADEKWSHLVYFVTLIVCHILFGILGALVTCWFSRRREFRADAGSAKFVGRDSMVSALRALIHAQDIKSQGLPASVTALGISGKKSNWASLWSTHPDLEVRIQALETGAV